MNNEEILTAIVREAKRIEEDCEHSAKSHLNTSAIWSRWHDIIGIPLTILATMSAIYAKEGLEVFNIALAVAILAAIQTLLSPDKQSHTHKIAGVSYLEIRNRTRRFREIDLLTDNAALAKDKLNILAETKDKLNKETPSPMWLGYLLAKFDIDAGRSKYHVDKIKEDK